MIQKPTNNGYRSVYRNNSFPFFLTSLITALNKIRSPRISDTNAIV